MSRNCVLTQQMPVFMRLFRAGSFWGTRFVPLDHMPLGFTALACACETRLQQLHPLFYPNRTQSVIGALILHLAAMLAGPRARLAQ